MFLMKIQFARRVAFLMLFLAVLPGAAMAQNPTEMPGDATGTSWQNGLGNGPTTTSGSYVDVDSFDESDDEDEEPTAEVIDGAKDPRNDGGLAATGPSQALAKVQGYFDALHAKLRALMTRGFGR